MPVPPCPLVFVRWLDNCYREGEHSVEEMGSGAELSYYGLLVKETPETLTLSMELPHDGRTRNAFDILKQNILERREVEVSRAFPKPRKPKAPKGGTTNDGPNI